MSCELCWKIKIAIFLKPGASSAIGSADQRHIVWNFELYLYLFLGAITKAVPSVHGEIAASQALVEGNDMRVHDQHLPVLLREEHTNVRKQGIEATRE